jgi:hypothetical protein
MLKKFLMVPVLVAAVFAGGCAKDGDPFEVSTKARVGFFNATTGMTGSGGFTTNGQFASGSAVAFGKSTPSCAIVDAGSAAFGFGAANAGGTGLNGVAIATLNNQTLSPGRSYTVVTAGSTTSATLFLLDDTFAGSLASNQAAVRFVNLAPETGTSANSFTVIKGTLGADGTVFASNIVVGAPTSFSIVTSGSNAFTILQGHTTIISGSDATFNLQAGCISTIAIVPTSGGFQLINIPRCS